jgi:hypothetical protein
MAHGFLKKGPSSDHKAFGRPNSLSGLRKKEMLAYNKDEVERILLHPRRCA